MFLYSWHYFAPDNDKPGRWAEKLCDLIRYIPRVHFFFCGEKCRKLLTVSHQYEKQWHPFMVYVTGAVSPRDWLITLAIWYYQWHNDLHHKKYASEKSVNTFCYHRERKYVLQNSCMASKKYSQTLVRGPILTINYDFCLNTFPILRLGMR